MGGRSGEEGPVRCKARRACRDEALEYQVRYTDVPSAKTGTIICIRSRGVSVMQGCTSFTTIALSLTDLLACPRQCSRPEQNSEATSKSMSQAGPPILPPPSSRPPSCSISDAVFLLCSTPCVSHPQTKPKTNKKKTNTSSNLC